MPENMNTMESGLETGREYLGVDKIDGPLLFVRKTHPVGYRDLVECVDPSGNVRQGMVLDTSDDTVVVQVFQGNLRFNHARHKGQVHGRTHHSCRERADARPCFFRSRRGPGRRTSSGRRRRKTCVRTSD